MEKEIVEGKIGTVGAYDVEFKNGMLVAKVGGSHEIGLTVAVEVSVSAHAVLAAIKKAIPGQIDDAILDVLEAALVG